MTDETVSEVCAEMQDARHLSKPAIECGNHLLSDWYYDDECQGWLSYFSNRLLSAYEREMAAKDAYVRRKLVEEGIRDLVRAIRETRSQKEANHEEY